MREIISLLMLSVDEAWLTHAARLHASNAITPADVWLEDSLFQIEADLERAHRNAAPTPDGPSPRLLPPVRGSFRKRNGFQPQ